MQNKYFRSYPASQDSLNRYGQQAANSLSPLVRFWLLCSGFLFLVVSVGLLAVLVGGSISTDITPTRIRVEVIGRPK